MKDLTPRLVNLTPHAINFITDGNRDCHAFGYSRTLPDRADRDRHTPNGQSGDLYPL